MKILWIPHSSWSHGRQRAYYFIERLKQRHEIHVLTWTEPAWGIPSGGLIVADFLNPRLHLDGWQEWTKNIDNLYLHHYKRFQNVRFTPYLLRINQRRFQAKIRSIVSDYGIDVVICAPNHYLNGFPPFQLGMPLIFDYLDYYSDREVREAYIRNSDAVLCVSHKLLDEAMQYNRNSFYLPNGADLKQFQNTDPEQVKERFHLKGCKIVSLIGLTLSPSLFLLDTLPIVKEAIPEVKYLIVGDNYMLPKIKRKAKNSSDIVFTGWVEPEKIQDYFAASDLGTYPTDKTVYYDSGCPIKILEYTAARKPVVSTDLEEVRTWGFPNVLLSKPNKTDFASKIIKGLTTGELDYPSLEEFDIGNLASRLEAIIENLVS